MAENKISTSCDSRCQYADPEKSGECNCICKGKNHGQGSNSEVWDQKHKRLSVTRKAFRKSLNNQEPRSGTHLYRRDRLEFNKQYTIWKENQLTHEESNTNEISTVPQGSEFTIIKDAKVGDNYYSHIRRQNGKTEYRNNDKVITKKEIPTELGW